MPVRNALAAGISFKTTIDIPNISLYSNMIDFEKTEMIKRPFPETVGAQIMPMEISVICVLGCAYMTLRVPCVIEWIHMIFCVP